ncbi:MAG TPA: SDR family NAD(P)-dependent oxidoreductase [Trebonia sp.]|jgi:NADP-dependent 3-hydroxy acid dehydrogenase YdfG
MPTIAIVGAGPGLGLSIARRFGREGFQVALISRSQTKLDVLAGELGKDGITAAGFVGDVRDRPSLTAALAAAADRFGPVDVLEYSPAPVRDEASDLTIADVTDVTVENIQPQVEYYVYGGVTAVQAVLPGMLERGSGTLLFTTGASSALVFPAMGNIAIASAGLRNYALALNAALADKGVYAAHVPLATWIGAGGPETQADTIADIYWELYTSRDQAERLYSTL